MVIRACQVTRALLTFGIAGVAQLVAAATPASHSVSIPAEDLGTALLTFAAVTHHQIAFDYRRVQGYKSTALSGSYTVAEGLRVLIGPAPFLIRATPSGVLTLAAKPAASLAADARAATGQSSVPDQDIAPANQAPQEEVTVSARRAQLEPRVSRFVTQVSALDGSGGLARWQTPVCPSVTGLSKDDGEFILGRMSEIARVVGVPLAAEHCHPNLFVFVTADPKQLLEAMERRGRYRAVTFGDAEPKVVDEFISTPRAARVWYDSVMETADDTTPIYSSLDVGVAMAAPGSNGQVGDSPGGLQSGRVINDWERASRVARAMVSAFSYVYVVVDSRRLPGVTRGQLADYISMVALAQIKPAAQLGDAPTILRLFDGAPQAALPGMSLWDRALLKSLYAIEQNVRVQQGEIALDMVREIVN